jgi:hypothetical protein
MTKKEIDILGTKAALLFHKEMSKKEIDITDVRTVMRDMAKKKIYTPSKAYDPHKGPTMVRTIWIGSMQHTVKYGMDYIRGNDQPYFAIGAETRKNGKLVVAGTQHDLIREVFPQLADLIPYHLAGQNDGLPMHYIAKTLYHLKEDHNEEYAIHAARWGSLEGEVVDDLPPPDRQLLQLREPGLKEDFDRVMKQHHVQYMAPFVTAWTD